MPRNPFPSFHWYPKEWLSSTARALMTLEQQGAYLNLLSHAWLADPPCTLPDDDRALAQLSGLGDRWPESAAVIREWFEVRKVRSGGTRLVNTKLAQTYAAACRVHEARKASGKLGGEKSAEQRQIQGKQRLTVAAPELNLPSSSSSSLASTKQEKEPSRASRSPLTVGQRELFERFWSHVHRKVGRHQTEIEFGKVDPDGPLVDRMIAALEEQKTWPGFRPGDSYPMPDPCRWVKGKRWEDERPAAPAPVNAKQQPLRLVFSDGREKVLGPNQRVEFGDWKGGSDTYEKPNGVIAVRSGSARLVR